MTRVSLNSAQTQAMVSVLCTIGTYVNVDLREGYDGREPNGCIIVTAWRAGEPTTWSIAPDGETREQASTVQVRS